MLSFAIGTSGQWLRFTPDVLAHFAHHQQTRLWHREAGGQLFARIDRDEVLVVEATGPRVTDRRSRSAYQPDRDAEHIEIMSRFQGGLHFVGDWHTHPERFPQPSSIDLASTAEGFRRSVHELQAFVLVIVGNGTLPEALHVALHDGTNIVTMNATPCRSASVTAGTNSTCN